MPLANYVWSTGPPVTEPPDQRWLVSEVESLAGQVLEAIDGLPPTPVGSHRMPSGAECVGVLVGDHWGIYGAGGTFASTEPGSRTELRLQLLLDPAWLDRDFRERQPDEPWLFAFEATWAWERLGDLLRFQLPPDTVFRASLPPRPQMNAPGDRIMFPSAAAAAGVLQQEGRLGPPVSYVDGSGTRVQGFLTAGHCVEDPAHKTVDLAGPGPAPTTVSVLQLNVPSGLQGLGRALAGAVDAAIIGPFPQPLTGVGNSGAAGHLAAVQHSGQHGSKGQVVGYARWVATSTSAWCDCYAVATPAGDFSMEGDSGAAIVTSAGDVIGIVVGAAKAIGGCATALSFVQDIDAVTGHFKATVIP